MEAATSAGGSGEASGADAHDAPGQLLAHLLSEAAAGRPPTPDGTVDILPSLGAGLDDAVLAFNGHLVITTGLPANEVRAHFPDGDYLAWCDPRSMLWLSERAQRGLGTADVLLATAARSGAPPVDLVPLDVDHPRLEEGRLRRSEGQAWATADGAGMVSVARGLAGRWELAYEVEPRARGRGLGVALVRAARHLVPAGEVLWAQTAPGNVASLRGLLAAGMRPIAGETLLLSRPGSGVST